MVLEGLRLRRWLERLRQAHLGALLAASMGGLFAAILIAATLWARWQSSWPAPWNRAVWLWVGLIPQCGLVMLIAVRLGRRLVIDPLEEIRQAALRIADGAGRTGEQIATPVGQELQALTEAFNVMSTALQQEHELLELRVAERTARLDALNVKLQAEVEGRRRVEQSLRDSELRYRGLFDHALTGVVLLRLVRDKDGRPVDLVVTDMNAAAERLTGLRAVAAVGRPLGEMYPNAEKSLRETIARVALGGKPVQMEHTVPLLKRTFATSIFALRPEQVAVEFEDITGVKEAQRELSAYSERLAAMVEERTRELGEAQEQLVRRERLAFLGQMAGSVGHELRNPLAVIGNAATLLSYMLTDPDPVALEYIEEIGSQVKKSDKIIRDLLQMARSGRALGVPVPPKTLVAQVVSQAAIPGAVKVELDVAETLPQLLVDPQQIELVLNNLVVNACEAMPGGGSLRIGARQEEQRVALFVADSGHGITPENLSKLFEPLFTTKQHGLGLGLTICQNLVQLNAGTIEVESEVGRGTTFTVWLPVEEA